METVAAWPDTFQNRDLELSPLCRAHRVNQLHIERGQWATHQLMGTL